MKLQVTSYKLQERRGQSLAEILIAVAVGAIIIGSAAIGISVLLRSNVDSRASQTASFLAREFLDKTRSLSESDWHNIWDLSPKGVASSYKIVASGTTGLAIASGAESSTIENITYTRYFSVENVMRDANDTIVESGGADDPSTQKITAVVQWPSGGQNREIAISEYFTRWRNKIFRQSDWSGGPAGEVSSTEPDSRFSSSSNIDYTSSSGSIIIQGF